MRCACEYSLGLEAFPSPEDTIEDKKGESNCPIDRAYRYEVLNYLYVLVGNRVGSKGFTTRLFCSMTDKRRAIFPPRLHDRTWRASSKSPKTHRCFPAHRPGNDQSTSGPSGPDPRRRGNGGSGRFYFPRAPRLCSTLTDQDPISAKFPDISEPVVIPDRGNGIRISVCQGDPGRSRFRNWPIW